MGLVDAFADVVLLSGGTVGGVVGVTGGVLDIHLGSFVVDVHNEDVVADKVFLVEVAVGEEVGERERAAGHLALVAVESVVSAVDEVEVSSLVGTVVNNSILLVEFINQNKEKMGVHEAVVAAGKLRMRPILMTTLTTVVGMIPLSLGIGAGGEMMAPMAISVIGGLSASTLLTLIIIPCLYEMIDNSRNKREAKREEKAKEIAELERQWAIEDAI